jgi:hypothetical protein
VVQTGLSLAQVTAQRAAEAAAPTYGQRPGDPRAPLVVAYGAGVDSTAMLVGMVRRGIRPDLILFADTGAEQPHTYAYLDVMQRYLAAHGFPPIRVVRYRAKRLFKHGHYTTIEQNCLVNMTLPSIAFGFQRKACSDKWKITPQNEYVAAWPPAHAAWNAGLQIVKAIGYDAGPADMKRGRDLEDDEYYLYWYPLRDWGWDRERCVAEIAAEGLPVPRKSACFICPAQTPAELDEMIEQRPRLADRILDVEAAAKKYLADIEGLWGTGRKGKQKKGSKTGAIAYPGAMSEWILARRAGKQWKPAPKPAPTAAEQAFKAALARMTPAERKAAKKAATKAAVLELSKQRTQALAQRGPLTQFAPDVAQSGYQGPIAEPLGPAYKFPPGKTPGKSGKKGKKGAREAE